MEKLPILRLNTYKIEEKIIIPKKKETIVVQPKIIKEVKTQPKKKSIKKIGVVSWYKKDKGYGFIKPNDNSKNIFFYYKELKKINLDNIESETLVKFKIQETNNRIEAYDIKILKIPTKVNIKNIADKVLNVLIQKYPKTFKYPKPLAIGIKEQLLIVSEELGLSKNELKIFLTYYCRSRVYKETLILNAKRVNLKGEFEGVVTEQQVIKPKTKV